MKFKEKLKKTGVRSKVAYIVAFIAIIYILMAAIKGLHLLTEETKFPLGAAIHYGTQWLLNHTWFFPVNYIWQKIPYIPFEGRDFLGFYKVIIPPMVIILICALFIYDHKHLKAKYYELKSQIEKEIALRDMRKEAGLENVSETATVDIVISNATNNDPAWNNTGWGQIAIGVAIALLVAAFGLN